MIYNSVLDLIGNTPIVEFKDRASADARILLKLEGYNPTGSIKDRACMFHISDAVNSGKLNKEKVILDASSGNMACALAFFGKMLGYRVKVVCNSKLTLDKRQFIQYFGADLDVYGDFTIEGNRLCATWATNEPEKYVFLDQLHNPQNPIAYCQTLAPEIHRAVPDVKVVVGSLGSGGNICGSMRYFAQAKPDTLMIAAQAAPGTKIPGMGSFSDGDYITPFIQEVFSNHRANSTLFVDQTSAAKYTRLLADQGIFVGFQGGGVVSAAIEAVRKYGIAGTVVAIIGDSGWKNMDKLKML